MHFNSGDVSESLPKEISKSGNKTSNFFFFQNWFLSTYFEISHDLLDQINSLSRENRVTCQESLKGNL